VEGSNGKLRPLTKARGVAERFFFFLAALEALFVPSPADYPARLLRSEQLTQPIPQTAVLGGPVEQSDDDTVFTRCSAPRRRTDIDCSGNREAQLLNNELSSPASFEYQASARRKNLRGSGLGYVPFVGTTAAVTRTDGSRSPYVWRLFIGIPLGPADRRTTTAWDESRGRGNAEWLRGGGSSPVCQLRRRRCTITNAVELTIEK